MWRLVAALLLLAATGVTGDDRPTVALSWYPLRIGNTWVYADEWRDADGGYGIDNPRIGRWTTTETVIAAEGSPDGIKVVVERDVSAITRVHGWHGDPTRLASTRTEWLVRGACIYTLETADGSDADDIWPAYDGSHRIRAAFRHALLRGDVPAQYCFPMTAGAEWGRTPSTPPNDEDVWRVRAMNGDPFGTAGARTFHVSGFQGSGDTTDYWFQEGVGVTQFVEVHHGTYDEIRRRLVKTTIDGVTKPYALQPARTPPLEPGECRAGTLRWVRADGTLIPTELECEGYAVEHR